VGKRDDVRSQGVRARRGSATRDEVSPTGIWCARSLMSTS
jgi:hypothetical protein